jgi:DNA-binding response OmpR family regulator
MKRVLVVDDEHLTADTLGLIFRKHGFDTRVAYTVDDALRQTGEFAPSLILCDITMPGRDGLELLVELVESSFDGSIMVLTGYHNNLASVGEQFSRMTQRTHMLTKPCRPEELIHEANKILTNIS